MTRHPEYWLATLKALTSTDKNYWNFSPVDYQNWLNIYFKLIRDQQQMHDVQLEGSITMSMRQSKKLFRLRPLWAMSYEEKRFKERRLLKASMSSGVFENPKLSTGWSFQRELVFDLDGHEILVERTMNATGNLQKLTLMRANRKTTDLQVEQRVNHRTFRVVPTESIGNRADLSSLLHSRRSISENIPATLI